MINMHRVDTLQNARDYIARLQAVRETGGQVLQGFDQRADMGIPPQLRSSNQGNRQVYCHAGSGHCVHGRHGINSQATLDRTFSSVHFTTSCCATARPLRRCLMRIW